MTNERQRLVEDNIQLAHFVANRYRGMPLEFEDIRSSAYLGLVKAAGSFDDGKGTAFSAYAVIVMTNEILMYARRQKKHSHVTVSLDAPLIQDEDISLMDIVPDADNPYGVVELADRISREMENLTSSERRLLVLKAGNPGATQADLSEMAGISQSMISRTVKAIRRKLAG